MQNQLPAAGPVSSAGEPQGTGLSVPTAPLQYPVMVAASPASEAKKPSSLDVKAVLYAFQRRWFIALTLGLVLGSGAAATAWFLVPAPYSSYSELLISERVQKVLYSVDNGESGFHTFKQTQMRLAKSPFVMAAALRHPEVSSLPLLRKAEHPVKILESQVHVSSPATEFIRISMSGDDPQTVAAIVNAVTDAYAEEVVDAENNRQLERKNNLERIQREIEVKLRAKRNAERRLAEALHTGDSEALTIKQQMAVEYFAQLRKNHAEVRFELMRAEMQLSILEQGEAPDMAEIEVPESRLEEQLAQDGEIQRIHGRVAQVEDLIRQTERRVSNPQHPVILQHRSELKRLQNDLELRRSELRPEIEGQIRKWVVQKSEEGASQIRRQVEILTQQEEQLREELEGQKLAAKRLGITSFELEALKKDARQIEDVATRIGEEIRRLEVELQSPPRITLHRKAEVPHEPDRKRKYQMVGLSGFGVFGLILGGIVLLEYRSRRISSVDEVIDGLNFRILGSLPLMPRWATGTGGGKSRTNRRAIWKSIWTESVDSTRTVLLRDAGIESRKIVMVSSAMGGEGKSTLSCHLGTSFVRGGRRTLLVDTDMRRPSLHKVFDVPLKPGLAEVLRGEAELDEVILPVSPEGLFLIPAGSINQATLKALAQDGPRLLFERVRNQFDFIVVDSAPVLPVNDSLLIGQYVDATVFAIRRDVSRFGKVASACERLTSVGVDVLGAVVIGLDERSYGYQYPYRYGDYGAYGYHVSANAR